MPDEQIKIVYPELSSLSLPYAVAITELELEVGFLRSALQESGEMDHSPFGDLYTIHSRTMDPQVVEKIQRIFKIANETAEIRFQEIFKKKTRWYWSIVRGRIVKTDGVYDNGVKYEPKGGE